MKNRPITIITKSALALGLIFQSCSAMDANPTNPDQQWKMTPTQVASFRNLHVTHNSDQPMKMTPARFNHAPGAGIEPLIFHKSAPANRNDGFVGIGNPAVFKNFSSERLKYHLPCDNNLICQQIVNLVSQYNISKTLFSPTISSDEVRASMYSFFEDNSKFIDMTPPHKTVNNYKLSDNLVWGVSDKHTNQLIGVIMAEVINQQHALRLAPNGEMDNDLKNSVCINISYAVDSNYQRRGYATEMTLALIDSLFKNSSASVIFHNSDKDNIGSGLSAQKCGFQLVCSVNGQNLRVLRKQ